MKTKLQIGDIIIVSNPLCNDREYPVTSIEGNRAVTGFRTFSTRVYNGKRVYEHGKRLSPIYNNCYTVKEAK